jgi:hypothetical protein
MLPGPDIDEDILPNSKVLSPVSSVGGKQPDEELRPVARISAAN